MAMAKKPPRSSPKLNSPADGPENISRALAKQDAEPAGERVQQAPGDALAARPIGEPTDEDIRARAYEMYLERGGHHGLDFDDWVRAERELRRR
jgi:DUF2934 family protein